MAKAILRKKNTAGSISLSDVTQYNKATVTKAACWYKHRHTDQCSSRERPEINPHTNGQSMTKQQEYTVEK